MRSLLVRFSSGQRTRQTASLTLSPPQHPFLSMLDPCSFRPFGEEKKLIPWSLDNELPDVWRRDDIVLWWANDAEGAMVLYKVCLLTAPATSTTKVSVANSLCSMGALLENPRWNPKGHMFEDLSEITPWWPSPGKPGSPMTRKTNPWTSLPSSSGPRTNLRQPYPIE